MSEFDFDNASADELWEYCLREYNTRNPIVLRLIDNFYDTIGKIIKRLEIDGAVLEAGCGAGESARRILQCLNGQRFEISDFDERYVSKLKETEFPAPVTQESVYELQREDDEFDCVFLLEVLEHLERPDAALRELFRVSRKHVIVSAPNEPLWRILNLARGKYIRGLGNTPGHINHWSAWSMRRLLSKHGRVLEIHKSLPWIIALAEVR